MDKVPYFVLVVAHAEGVGAHVVPSLHPRRLCRDRPLVAVGPFPTLVRALGAQQRLAQEWGCPCPLPDHDGFVAEHWAGWPQVEQAS